jgi:hypothetical protein
VRLGDLQLDPPGHERLTEPTSGPGQQRCRAREQSGDHEDTVLTPAELDVVDLAEHPTLAVEQLPVEQLQPAVDRASQTVLQLGGAAHH